MGERTKYTPGTFCWADVSTTDQEGAKSFYGSLFGWSFEDMPAGEDGATYSMAQLDGKPVAAVSPQPPQQRDAGLPATWNCYVSVEDADATLSRARELGGTVHADAFDVMDAGRMGVIQDPQGAYLLLWQPGQHFGAALVNSPGALSWNELGVPDVEAAADFYSQLLGWKVTPMEGVSPPYFVISTADGRSNGGIREPAPPDAPPFWLAYFATADLEAALKQVDELGGNVLVPATDIGMAKIAVVQDPQGAVFALYDGRLED